MQGDAGPLQPFEDGIGQLRVIKRQDAVLRLDHGDVGAQLAESDAQFQADIAGADDHQLFRQPVERQGLGGRQHRVAERQGRQFDGL